ncbi:MAG: NlpC/P60 family protein [Planctomycetota bacterium]|nr:NlpC/P60 family protein [Planctomycetota bacterium]
MASSRELMLEEAKKWLGVHYKSGGDSAAGIDCSHLVARIIRKIDPGYQYKTVSAIRKSSEFLTLPDSTAQPKAGDFISWSSPGHVVIITNPTTGEFLGAQSSGVGTSNYLSNPYWKDRPGRVFLRYHKVAD